MIRHVYSSSCKNIAWTSKNEKNKTIQWSCQSRADHTGSHQCEQRPCLSDTFVQHTIRNTGHFLGHRDKSEKISEGGLKTHRNLAFYVASLALMPSRVKSHVLKMQNARKTVRFQLSVSQPAGQRGLFFKANALCKTKGKKTLLKRNHVN
jgi:hypothetical protein